MILSCSSKKDVSINQRITSPTFNSEAQILFEKISAIKDLHDRKLALLTLSPVEKFKVWQYKFYLMFEKHKSNTEKIKFLESIYSDFAQLSYNSKDNLKRKEYSRSNSSILFSKARIIFGDLEALNLLFQLVPLKISEIPYKSQDILQNEKLTVKFPCECIIGQPGGCYYLDEGGNPVFGTCYDPNCEQPNPSEGGCGIYGYEPCDGYRCHFE